ncbi:MAG TPA: ATP-binding cassette domain-containing protein, partial [Trueperaceae bacterium]|nr:ATP-binding cassette domain-containing protein [Trueperaceae bacterium]
MVELNNLTKEFKKLKAVDNLNFKVNSGEVYGLLGANGAGKTTTLRTLATLIGPTSGSASIKGLDIVKDSEEIRKNIGVVNGGMGLYDRLNGKEILHYFGKFYGMSGSKIDARIKELDDLLDLGDTLHRRSSEFSTGMKQK